MASLDEIAGGRTDLSTADVEWLHVLLSEWQLLADLSFADLVLWVPLRSPGRFVVAGQMRPTTGPTQFTDDLFGRVVDRTERSDVAAAFGTGTAVTQQHEDPPGTVEAIPVRRAGRVIAVVSRHLVRPASPRPSPLEDAYLDSARVLSRMVAQGRFPFPAVFGDPELSPRVGDGLLRLDAAGSVVFASPNAQSAYRRLGLAGDLVGADLAGLTAELAPALGPVDEAVSVVASGRTPRTAEVEVDGVAVLMRSIPLQPEGRRTGALVLVRDVTDLRRRDRAMETKDATIREIHHRVKNNLQTVASLLRLQSRRIDEPAARVALDEAVRRVGSIAVVHEMLSRTPDEHVGFDEIADRLMTMVRDVAVSDRVDARRAGTFGVLPSELAMPLAMALTEVFQNAVEHGFGGTGGVGREGVVEVTASRTPERLRVDVSDDGVGVQHDFDLESDGRLGLQIVRTLVVGELAGSLTVRPRRGGGTLVSIDVPLRH